MKQYLINFLTNNYYLIMKAILSMCAIFFLINFDGILNLFKEINKKTYLALLLIILLGFIVRMWFIPHIHHVYFDEFEHINIAENMMYHGKFFVTLKGTDEICEGYSRLQLWPPGYHTLLGLIFSIFGNSESVAYNLSVVIGSLSMLVIFLIVYLLFNNQSIALYSTFLFNLIPIHLKYSGASELGIASLFFMLLTILTSLIYLKFKNIKSLLLLTSIIAFTAYIRPENSILLLLILFFVIIMDIKNFNRTKLYFHTILFISLLFLLLIPYFLHIIYLGMFVLPPPGWDENLISRLVNLKKHLFGNLAFWFSNYHPLSFTVTAIYGILCLVKKNKKVVLFFSIWFVAFLLLYSSYHIGNFLVSDTDRYTLNLYISLIIFSGVGIYEFINLVNFKRIVLCLVIAYLLIDVVSPLRLGLNRTLSRDVYKEYQFILSNKERIAGDIYVISYIPAAIISTIHKKAISPHIFVEIKQIPKEVILFKDYWWYQNDLNLNMIEEKLRKIYDFELLSQERFSDDKCFSFIKLKIKESNR